MENARWMSVLCTYIDEIVALLIYWVFKSYIKPTLWERFVDLKAVYRRWPKLHSSQFELERSQNHTIFYILDIAHSKKYF